MIETFISMALLFHDVMDIDRYQELTRRTAIYPNREALVYTSLGLNDESGEVAGAVKKHIRGDYGEEELRSRVKSEAGDTLWYWVRLLDELDIDASDAMEKNANKVLDRLERDKIRGDGEER